MTHSFPTRRSSDRRYPLPALLAGNGERDGAVPQAFGQRPEFLLVLERLGGTRCGQCEQRKQHRRDERFSKAARRTAMFHERALPRSEAVRLAGFPATRNAMSPGGSILQRLAVEIGRASCRESVCQYV